MGCRPDRRGHSALVPGKTGGTRPQRVQSGGGLVSFGGRRASGKCSCNGGNSSRCSAACFLVAAPAPRCALRHSAARRRRCRLPRARNRPAKSGASACWTSTPAALNVKNIDAFRAGMRDARLCRGAEPRHRIPLGDGRLERLPELVAELIRLKCDVMVTRGTPAALAAKDATPTIPIVMAAVGEPVETGAVQSLSRPAATSRA